MYICKYNYINLYKYILVGEFKSDGTPVRPRKNLDLSFISPLPKQDPTETEAKLKEIYKMQGKLKINGSQYYATQNDLEDLGELGNGSCGHVVKMLHKPSNQVIAVKVSSSLTYIHQSKILCLYLF